MAKLNVTYPAVDVMVNGTSYRKVDRKAQAGDIVKALAGRMDLTEGAFYGPVRPDSDGDLGFDDNVGDFRWSLLKSYTTMFEVYTPVVGEVAADVRGQITFDGATYRKVGRSAREGDVIVFTEEYDYITKGEPYAVTRIDFAEDAHIDDDDGDDFDTCAKEFDVYEKVAVVTQATSTPPAEYREVKRIACVGETIKMTYDADAGGWKRGDTFTVIGAGSGTVSFTDNDGDGRTRGGTQDYVVLVPVSSSEPTPTPLKYSAGGYVKVTGNSVGHEYAEGRVVKIAETKDNAHYGGQQFRAEAADGTFGNWLVTDDVEPADEAAFEAQKKPKLIPIGSYGKITQAGITRGIFTTHEFAVGELVKVDRHARLYDDRVHAVSVSTGKGWFVHHEDMAEITAEEVAAIEKEAEETAKWAKLGRKVGEFKRGDIAEATRLLGKKERVIGEVEDVPQQEDGGMAAGLRLPDGTFYAVDAVGMALVTPVEQRFDTESAA